MEITEVRIKLMEDSDDRLQAFCSITFDNCFVVRDLKIIEGTNGPFVAMPSRKLTSHCRSCGSKNHLRAQHCNNCGEKLRDDRASRDSDGRTKLYADIAHPINSECREMIQDRVIAAYNTELVQAQQPGYVSKYDDDYDDAGPEDADQVTRVESADTLQGPHRVKREGASAMDSGAKRSEQEPKGRPPERPATDASPKADPPEDPPASGFGAGIFDD